MVQVQKSRVREAILVAARAEFAESGFHGASVARIAARAGVSTGNVYTYFDDKGTLLAKAVPRSFVRELRSRLVARVSSFPAASELEALPATHEFHRNAAALVAFLAVHRHECVFVLERAEGSVYARERRAIERYLIRSAEAVLTRCWRPEADRAALRETLSDVYGNLVAATARILRRHSASAAIQAAITSYAAYHLAGLAALARPPR